MDNTVPSSQQRPTQQPVAPSVPAAPPMDIAAQASPPSPALPKPVQIGSANKETGPIAVSSPSESGAQVEQKDDEDEIKVAKQEVMLGQKVAPSQEVPLSQELKEAGVEQGADIEQEIPTIVQRAGMRVTSSDDLIPESHIPEPKKLPINAQHAKQLDKRHSIKESIKWLARVILRQWDKVKASEKNPAPKQEL